MKPPRLAIGLAASFWIPLGASAALAQPPSLLQQERQAPQGYMEVRAIATSDPKLARDDDHTVLLAIRAARAMAYRKLLEMTAGIVYEATSKIGEIVRREVREPVVRTRVAGAIRGARVVKDEFQFTQGGEVLAQAVAAMTVRPGREPTVLASVVQGPFVVWGYGYLDLNQPRQDAERKAYLQALLNALEEALPAVQSVEVKASTVLGDLILKEDLMTLQGKYRVGKQIWVERRDLYRDFALVRQLTSFRFQGPKGEGLRHIVNQQMPGRVSEREVRFVEALLKAEGLEVTEKGMLKHPRLSRVYKVVLRFSSKDRKAGH